MNGEEAMVERSKQLQDQLTRTREDLFFTDILFSPQWLLIVGALIGAYVLLWRLIDRTRLFPILFVGLLIFGIALAADGIGADFLWWDYPHMLMPWGPRLLSVDLIIPVGYMLIYQYFRSWRPYFLASLVLAASYAFVLEPISQALDIYVLYKWKHIYSFPIYVGLALLAKGVADKVESKQRSAARS
ncbi:hypothetical protein MO973_44180 [Paenibacillus sp. TRM 82003]|nr:hypothetical protein [Paenibacillus sp. TRM 82003]